jgi:hypothetical protein
MLRFFDRLNLNPSERRLVVVIAAVAFVVVNYWIVWPRFDDYSEITEEMDSMQRRREIFEREIARRPIYELTLRKLQEEGSVLPAGEEHIQFRSDMERLAREVGLTVPRWGQVVPERGSGGTNAFFESITLTMNQVSGTEPQFIEFLYRVGAGNSTIRVKELSLKPGNFDVRAQGRTNLVAESIKLVAGVQKAVPTPPVSSGAPAVPTTQRATGDVASASARTDPSVSAVLRTNLPVRGLPVRTNLAAGAKMPRS